MIKDFVRKDLAGFEPYYAPLRPFDVKVDANENPFSHPQEVIEAAEKFFADKDNLTRYPDTDNTKLREKIAEFYGVKPSNVTCGVGSDQLIEYILKVFLEPGDKVMVPNPSFSMYGLTAKLNHGVVVQYELNEDFTYNTEAIIEIYKTQKPKIVFICTPNNPTGTVISKNELISLLTEIDCPVVVDEAYSEFVEENIVDQIAKFPQLIVLRTFSKIYGLAGLRIGYALANPEMIDIINICKAPYNLSQFSQEMGCIVLDNANAYENMAVELNAQREWLYNALKEVPIIKEVYPSKANFILVKVDDIEAVVDYCEKNKMLVRGFGTKGRLANCIRITVGTKAENQRLIECLKAFA